MIELTVTVSKDVLNKYREVVMDERKLVALKGSILKWKHIVAGTDIDRGVDNCPLCDLFYYGHACRGCPVFAKTGQTACQGTPYQDEFVPAKSAYGYEKNGPRTKRLARLKKDMAVAAKVELKFLQGLLP